MLEKPILSFFEKVENFEIITYSVMAFEWVNENTFASILIFFALVLLLVFFVIIVSKLVAKFYTKGYDTNDRNLEEEEIGTEERKVGTPISGSLGVKNARPIPSPRKNIW